jgi:recombinational DNA repair protein RecT
LRAAYAVVQYKNGGVDFEVVNRTGAMRAKAASAAKNKADSPWNQPENEWTMWVKTAVHQLSKRIPLSPELQRANDLEEMAEQRGNQDLSHVMDIEFEEMPKEIGNDKGNGEDKAPAETEPETAPDDGNKVTAQLAAFCADADSKPLYIQACEELDIKPDTEHSPAEATDIMSKIDEILERG